MKSIVLHPGSVVIGVAVACLGVFVASAQTSKVESVLNLPPRGVEYRIAGIPDPNDMVIIRAENGPYTVPDGKVFALTGLGSAQSGEGCGLNLNGIPMVGRLPNGTCLSQPFSTITAVPVGLSARAGEIIEVGPAGARAFGFLCDQRP